MRDDLIARYEEAARIHGEAAERGDSERGNAAHVIIASVYRKLRDSDRLAELSGLMDSDNDSVRVWAATHSLTTNEKDER